MKNVDELSKMFNYKGIFAQLTDLSIVKIEDDLTSN